MNKTELIIKLNNECQYKESKGFYEWTSSDVQDDDDRSFCVKNNLDYTLCYSCYKLLDIYHTQKKMNLEGIINNVRERLDEHENIIHDIKNNIDKILNHFNIQ
jgi:hypothetical protein